jgi:hypothetical protein
MRDSIGPRRRRTTVTQITPTFAQLRQLGDGKSRHRSTSSGESVTVMGAICSLIPVSPLDVRDGPRAAAIASSSVMVRACISGRYTNGNPHQTGPKLS